MNVTSRVGNSPGTSFLWIQRDDWITMNYEKMCFTGCRVPSKKSRANVFWQQKWVVTDKPIPLLTATRNNIMRRGWLMLFTIPWVHSVVLLMHLLDCGVWMSWSRFLPNFNLLVVTNQTISKDSQIGDGRGQVRELRKETEI